MTEAELETEVRKLLKRYDVYGYHAHDSRRSQAGFPDWVVIGTRVLFRELKSADGQLSTEQTEVKYALLAARADWGVWRPADLRSRRIARELAAIARPTTHHRQSGGTQS